MSDKGLTISEAKAYANDRGKLGHAIESLLRHDGWKIFVSLYNQRKKGVKDKTDYASIEDFRADRRALEIIDGIIDEMPGFIEDATDAQNLLKKLTEAENQTPISLLLENEDEQASEA